MEIQKIFSDMYDEERIYSVLMSEDELALFSEVKEAVEEKNSKGGRLGTAGKVALGTGAGIALAGGAVQHHIADNVAKKVVKKAGNLIEKKGYGLGSRIQGYAPEVKKAVNTTDYILKRNKVFRNAKRADNIGTGIALTGAGLMAANHFLKKRKNKENK